MAELPTVTDQRSLILALTEALKKQYVAEPPPALVSREELIRRLSSLYQENSFSVGDIVRWKPGLKNRKYPREDQLAIVAQLFDPPIIQSREDPTSALFGEPLDIVLGTISDDGSFFLFHYDRRRLMPVR